MYPNTFAQPSETHIDSLINVVEEFGNNFYEKIYVCTNKEAYWAGDNIWFKAYITGVANEPSSSEVLYAQLVDSANNVINIKRYMVSNGVSTGSFQVDSTLKAGVYRMVFSSEKSELAHNAFSKFLIINNFANPRRSFQRDAFSKNRSEKTYNINLRTNGDFLFIETREVESNDYYLVVTVNGELVWASSQAEDLQSKVSLNLTELPIGNATAFIFDKQYRLIDKNSIPINLEKLPTIQSVISKNDSTNLNSVSILLKDFEQLALDGKVSIALYLKELNPTYKSENSILSHTYLQPEGSFPPFETSFAKSEEDTYNIIGHIDADQKKNQDIMINAISLGSGITFDTLPNKVGEFTFNLKRKHLKETFIISAQNKRGNPLKVTIYDTIKYNYLPVSEVSNSIITKKSLQIENSIDIKNYLDHMILPEITVTDSRIEEQNVNDSLLFSYFNNVKVSTFEGENINEIAGSTFMELLRQLTGIHLYNPTTDLVFLDRGYFTRDPVFFVLDGVPMGHNTRSLDYLRPNTIEEISIIKNLGAIAQFGIRARGGVVFITTEEFANEPIDPVKYHSQESKVSLFNYFEQSSSFIPSEKLESCIYWNPEAIIKDGQFQFDFETPTIPGTLVLKIEGLSEENNFISYQKEYSYEELLK